MSVAPALTAPAAGRPISEELLDYVKRDSARRQAEAWNDVLRDDPVLGPAASGFVVDVGPQPPTGAGARWPLVWRPLHGYGMTPAGWSPGYCWCGHWAYTAEPERSGRLTGRALVGCAGLGAALGLDRPPRSHAEAQDLARAAGMDWDHVPCWWDQPNG